MYVAFDRFFLFAHVDSHCIVEWDELGKPRNVVQRKEIIGLDGKDDETVAIGDMCKVKVREGGKVSYYQATMLATGK